MASISFSPGTVIPSTWLNDVNVAIYTTIPSLSAAIAGGVTKTSIGLGNVDNTSDINKPISTATQTALNAKQDASAKDASGGFVGLTGYSINFKNAAGSFVSTLVNNATAAHTYTFPDKNITVAGTTNETMIKPTIKGYTEQTQTLSGAAVSPDPTQGTIIVVNTTANTTVTLPAAIDGTCYTVCVIYGGTHTLTFAGGTTLKWAGGAPPTPASATGKMDKYVFTCIGSSTYGQDGGRSF